jgi:putative transposase
MGRAPRANAAGFVYHVLNRANGKLPLFEQPGDYDAFEQVLEEAQKHCPMRILAYCVMSNHWHLVLWPEGDGDLSRFTGWLTLTHTQRWHAFHKTTGSGHLYQGRFKSFAVQEDEHLLTVIRYVERNPLRAGLVPGAEHWRWSSLWRRERGNPASQNLLSDWPLPVPDNWLEWVNQPQTDAEIVALERCSLRGQPYGSHDWCEHTAIELGIQATLRPRGRPRKRHP